MPVMQCPVCGYVIANPSNPCPSCGNLVRPTVADQPSYPYPIKTKQYDDDSHGGISRTAIAAIICAVVIVLAGGGGFYYYRVQEISRLKAERIEQERLARIEQERLARAEQERLARIEQERAARIERERIAAEQARKEEETRRAQTRESRGGAQARNVPGEKTYTFPNGISFSYPSKYEAMESNMTGLGQSVLLMDMPDYSTRDRSADPMTMMTFSVIIMENIKELEAAMSLLSEALEKNPIKDDRTKITNHIERKITIAGKEASLSEIYMSFDFMDRSVDTFTRVVAVPLPGNIAVGVHSMAMGKSKFDECRAIGARIESSLKF